MFETTSDDIASLNDEDLRSLVGLLCEAELRTRGLPVSAVTWGGNQNAPDGGIDVRVTLPAGTAIEGFVPRPYAGYQVKQPDMTPAAIGPEMRPDGALRPSIRELAENAGAYILVSSGSNVSDSALADRRAAMGRAVARLRSGNALFLDFYDRARLATWVRPHAGIGLWVRSKVGRALPGWRPYDAWAFSPEGVNDAYLIEDQARLHAGMSDERGVPIAEGLRRIRDALRAPRGVVRLVGLSGVGKTRLVQALFDARVGESNLDPALAVYTDMAEGPDPPPAAMAMDLIANRRRAILVVDNCPPDLHQRLSEKSRAAGSTLSVMTVEYDIQDDQPEGTDVFRLESSSPDLIEKLIQRRYSEMSQVDARTIAHFSGGNARVALSLANTLEKNETLAGLSNQELFRRLFHQRQAPDESLLRAAQACALVYSFQGEAVSGKEAELPKLGAIADMSALELYGKLAELKRRDLLQQRSVWRAVLPHAIANRLAAMALQSVPIPAIEAQFDIERLMRSFSRRLGYLHDSPEAMRLVESWLAPDGKLGNIPAFNDLGRAMFANVAPVSPPATLAALERASAEPDRLSIADDGFGLNKTAHLLRSLAYEPELFDRSVGLLVTLAEAEARKGRREDITHIFEELFHIYLSGTYAPVEQRARCINALLRSEDAVRRSLGVVGLNALLKAWQFHSSHSFEFGARPRDFGYWPRERHEIEHWYSCVVRMLEPLAVSDLPVAEQVRHALAAQFRGLWRKAEIYDDLERASQAISAKVYWQEGWIAIRKTLRSDAQHLSDEGRTRLAALERRLRPRILVQQVRAVVLTTAWGALDFADIEEEEDRDDVMAPHKRAQATAETLGTEVAADAAAFQELLPDLVRGQGARMVPFGRGLARAASERKAVWERLVEAVRNTPDGERNFGVFAGYLNGLHEAEPVLCEALLEETVADATLAPWFPVLQTSVPLDSRAVDRLVRSLALGQAPVAQLDHLAGGRTTDPLTGPELSGLLLAIAAKPKGLGPALHILSMRIHSDRDAKRVIAPELITAGRALLASMEYEAGGDDSHDYRLRVVASTCLTGEGGATAAAGVARRFKSAAADGKAYPFHYDQFVQGLFKAQPRALLDDFFAGDAEDRRLGVRVIEDICYVHENPLDQVDDDAMTAWCAEDAPVRCPLMASIVTFARKAENEPLQWTPLALRLLEQAPDPIAVLDEFIGRFWQDRDGGRLSAIIEPRIRLLDDLKTDSNPDLTEFVTRKREALRAEIAKRRKQEADEDKDRDERFE